MKKSLAILFLTFSLFGFGSQTVHAQTVAEQYQDIQNQGLIFAGICESASQPCECRDSGKCTLDDILQLLVNLSIFIFGISGSVMMLIIVYGGFKWILAQGDSGKITEGKNALIGGIVGLGIIMGAYAAINVIVSVLKTGEVATTDIEETIGGSAGDIIQTQ